MLIDSRKNAVDEPNIAINNLLLIGENGGG
jgi:hypothetical protein